MVTTDVQKNQDAVALSSTIHVPYKIFFHIQVLRIHDLVRSCVRIVHDYGTCTMEFTFASHTCATEHIDYTVILQSWYLIHNHNRETDSNADTINFLIDKRLTFSHHCHVTRLKTFG